MTSVDFSVGKPKRETYQGSNIWKENEKETHNYFSRLTSEWMHWKKGNHEENLLFFD